VLACKQASTLSILEFELAASKDSPVVNPAFVIKNWGDIDAQLKIDGKETKCGKDFRTGLRHSLEGTDLIVWLKIQSTEPVQISLSSVAN
jgi:hypothetical protein